ncbi:MAG: alkaline phosphatase family protein [Acidobacteriaceae bacterium]|nr:alkaline phosphatase family protein [Acidobacteriaceae bacterium]MBV9765948.1 alkaline phosphatase family protein [Acidobacteriaceae bacterium]
MYEYKKLFALVAFCSLSAAAAPPENVAKGGIKHVLLISIDGMHAVDYLNCSGGFPGNLAVNNGEPYCPNLVALAATGVNFSNASTSKPSDSFPGLTAIVSGGSPRSFGVYYDVAYDRVLAPPQITTGNGVAGGICTPYIPNGTTTEYEEGIDRNQALLNGGAPGAGPTEGSVASIDPKKLIRDPFNNCAPVYPWNFPRTNTIFGVIHANGGYTAWSDKHPAYSSVSGPGDGKNLDDFYAPEINSDVTNSANQAAMKDIVTALDESCATLDLAKGVSAWTDSFFDIRCYDTLKVHAILNEIAGMNHSGSQKTKTPTIFGMNFQAVSVGEKLIESGVKGGYLDAEGTPSENLLKEIQFVDVSIGEMVYELRRRGLFDSTLIVITAKHGQSPIDPHRFYPIPGHSGTNGISPATLIATDLPGYIPFSESPLNPNGIGPTEDDVSLLWLAPDSDVLTAVELLENNGATIGLGQIYYGRSLQSMLDLPGLPPDGDSRTPDIIVTPNVGVIYTGSSKKQEEHGGFAHDDTNVMLLFSNPAFTPRRVTAAVQTAQIAPTILRALGLSPYLLDAVRIEGTEALPVAP